MKTLGLILGLAGACFATSWSGVISDSACGMSHAKMMAEHPNSKTDQDCTLACVKGGSEFVFVSRGKVYKLANQNNPDFRTHAGHTVEITGDLRGDTITAAKVEMKTP